MQVKSMDYMHLPQTVSYTTEFDFSWSYFVVRPNEKNISRLDRDRHCRSTSIAPISSRRVISVLNPKNEISLRSMSRKKVSDMNKTWNYCGIE